MIKLSVSVRCKGFSLRCSKTLASFSILAQNEVPTSGVTQSLSARWKGAVALRNLCSDWLSSPVTTVVLRSRVSTKSRDLKRDLEAIRRDGTM